MMLKIQRLHKFIAASFFSVFAFSIFIYGLSGSIGAALSYRGQAYYVAETNQVNTQETPETAIETLPQTIEAETETDKPLFEISAEETYMLVKIAMAEAEGESTEGKALVILTVLNRVESSAFPGTIQKVIFQKNQFTPISNGRYDKVEPNEDCYKALELVQSGWNESEGTLYFESCKDADNWHSRNLEFLFQCGCHKFYK